VANQEHLTILKQGREAWNEWRQQHPEIQPDLSDVQLPRVRLIEADLSNTYFYGADLFSANLSQVNLNRTDLSRANLSHTTLSYAKLSRAKLYRTRLSNANLFQADFVGADLREARLKEARLGDANLYGADLSDADLSQADLSNANLTGARIVRTNLTEANLTNCRIHGISAWDVVLEGARQESLVITHSNQPTITVDNLEVAQFIYLLLNNKKIRDVIDTITSKVVLILGRFTEERKVVLDALRNELRKRNYSPVLFDFEKPANRDFTETVRTLAHLARFIIADLTGPSSIPQELQAIIPDLEVPVQPLLLEAKREYAMFADFRKYHWVLPVSLYKDLPGLLASLNGTIIDAAEKKVAELALEKAGRLERP